MIGTFPSPNTKEECMFFYSSLLALLFTFVWALILLIKILHSYRDAWCYLQETRGLSDLREHCREILLDSIALLITAIASCGLLACHSQQNDHWLSPVILAISCWNILMIISLKSTLSVHQE